MGATLSLVFQRVAGLRAHLMLALVSTFLAVFTGLFAAYFCYLAGYAAIYYLVALLVVVMLPLVVVTRDDPARFAFKSMLSGLPVVAFIVPPGRLGISIFDYSMLFVLLTELWRKANPRQGIRLPLFPTPIWLWMQLLAAPIVLLAQAHGVSTWTMLENFLVYIFFWSALREIKTADGGERLFFLFSLGVIVLALGVLVEKVTHINLSLHSANLNQLSSTGGVFIHRAGGFFQDPQKAAQFFACSGVLLFAIGLGRHFKQKGIQAVVWLATAAAFSALILTASRAALIAGLLVIPPVILFGTRGNALIKLLAVFFVSLIFLVGLLVPTDVLIGMLPIEIASRLGTLDDSLAVRVRVWFDTWDMFADHPLTGVGLGGFKSYLIARNPDLQNYMGMAGSTGIGYIPDQPESGYFKILYEGGVVGSIAATLLVLAALRRAFRVLLAADAPAHWKTEMVGALASMLVFGLTFVTLFTLSDEKNLIVFVLPLALIWARSMALTTAHQRDSLAGRTTVAFKPRTSW